MAEGIGRRRVIGIAKETTFGTPASVPTHMLALLDTPRFNFVQNSAENEAALGNSYQINAVRNTRRMGNISINVKVDEDVLPLLFAQKFNISTATVPGETVVYKHTLTYNGGNSGAAVRSYTLFIDDPDNGDLRMSGVMFNNLNVIVEDGFVRAELEGTGRLPTSFTHTPVITNPNEFVARHANLEYANFSGTYSVLPVQSVTVSQAYNLSDENINFVIGDADLHTLHTTGNRFEMSISRVYRDTNTRADFIDKIRKKARLIIEDSDRYVTGSVASTRPKITIEYPDCYCIAWADTGGLDEIQTEEFTLLAVNAVGVTDAPCKIEIINAVNSY